MLNTLMLNLCKKEAWAICMPRLLHADWESLVCPHSSEESPSSSAQGSPCSWAQRWSGVVRTGWVTPARGFALAVSLPLQDCAGDTAALARALCHDSEAGLLDWGKQSIVVNLSCSVVQNNFIQTRVPSWSYSMSST